MPRINSSSLSALHKQFKLEEFIVVQGEEKVPELFIFCFNYLLQQRKVIITGAHNLGHKLSYGADVALLFTDRAIFRQILFVSCFLATKSFIKEAYNLGHKLSYFANVAMFLQIELSLDRFFLF